MKLRKLAFLGIAPLALGAALLGACGDDDDGGSGGGGGGNDEDYVAAICKAGKSFQEDIFAALEDIDLDASEEEQMEAFVGPFEDFANAIEDARPPSDLRDWHGDVVDAINNMVKELKDGNLEALEDSDDPIGDPPAGAADRLQAIADKNPDCQEADFDFGSDS